MFRDFVTGRTGVKYALVEIDFNRLDTNHLFAFAYDSQAFFARRYCTNRHDLNGMCLDDKHGGRLGSYYWYYNYNGNALTPLLYTAFSPEDAMAGAYGGVRRLSIAAGVFQTYGLSAHGISSLTFCDGLTAVGIPGMTPMPTALLVLNEEGMVSSAELKLDGGPGQVARHRVLFSYDTPFARQSGLPSSSHDVTNGFQVRVLELQLLTPGERLVEPPSFVPPDLFTSTHIGRVIYTNKSDHIQLDDGQLMSMDRQVVLRVLADLRKARAFFYIGLGILIMLSLLLLRLRSAGGRLLHKTGLH